MWGARATCPSRRGASSSTLPTTMEPECKRRKTGTGALLSWDVVPVLSPEQCQDVELLEAYAAPIFNKRETSRLVKELATVCPLDGLPHIKRVRACPDKLSPHPLEVLICLADHKAHTEAPSLDVLLAGAGHIDCSGLGRPFLVRIAARPPLTRLQFEKASCHWPTSFHEDKQVTVALRGDLFTEEHKMRMQTYMELAIQAAVAGRAQGMEAVGAVLVEPDSSSVLAVGHDCRHGPSPLLHAVMVCIDLVAHGQGGGAYTYKDYLACHFVGAHPAAEQEGHEELPYICTGYELYVTREPCIMCAMALVHSRVRRVFFGVPTPDGALGSRYKIHTQKDLNHHYEVFRGVMAHECEQLSSKSAGAF
ncbi:probable inactive tRNA-specific adenosine deaminase-like protein 3 isoform X1 [Polypterus senegalus]|uniref:probable inactive tRNA-specific adenosine deaminase-like protein 3 isoform X1 n=1 Tax=Polypterus senegalus TaxID=55291 RepID=UPI0019665481|nr:probable inactive tRNA-specific adenosine deaminase-like protein 3 isoform X1 [Polypterus senegalus]